MTDKSASPEFDELYVRIKSVNEYIKHHFKEYLLGKFLNKLSEEDGIYFVIANLDTFLPQEPQSGHSNSSIHMNRDMIFAFVELFMEVDRRRVLKRAAAIVGAGFLGTGLISKAILGNNMGKMQEALTQAYIILGGGTLLVLGKLEMNEFTRNQFRKFPFYKDILKGDDKENKILAEHLARSAEPILKNHMKNVVKEIMEQNEREI
jgi:hypothetical protein